MTYFNDFDLDKTKISRSLSNSQKSPSSKLQRKNVFILNTTVPRFLTNFNKKKDIFFLKYRIGFAHVSERGLQHHFAFSV